jgi:uncharacterized protein (TIGR03435 family)
MERAPHPVTLGIFVACSAFGQHATPSPAFQAASIKLNTSGGGGTVRIEPGSVTGRNVTVKDLLRLAYELQDPQISGPDWIGIERYDVVANGESSASVPQVRLMLRTLLADRFKLKSHRETRELPVYWMTVAEGGPKLRDPKEEETFSAASAGKSPFKPGFASIFSNKDLPEFAERLSRGIGRPVVDKTGIKGRYWFQLEWAADTPGPSPALVTAVKDQLGLNLEERSAPVEMLVIDSAEKPPGN